MDKVTLSNIISSSGYASVEDVNARLALIQEAIDDMVSRSGNFLRLL